MNPSEIKATVALAIAKGWIHPGPPMRPTTAADERRARTQAMHEAGLNTRGGPPQKRGPKPLHRIPAEIAMGQRIPRPLDLGTNPTHENRPYRSERTTKSQRFIGVAR